MPRPRGWLRNAAEYLAASAALGILGLLPARPAQWLAEAIARFAGSCLPRWRATAGRNLALAFPDLDATQRTRLMTQSFANLGRALWAVAWLPRLHAGNIGQFIAYEGFEHFQQAKAAGKGVLFLTAHLGNWELSAYAHALLSEPMDVMVRPLDNPLLDGLLDRRRRLSGNNTISKAASAREILRALRANRAVGILADQNAAGDDGVFVEVFGVAASATSGVARLAAKTGAAVIPGFAFWLPGKKRYVLKFYPALDLRSSGNPSEDIRIHTQQCQSAIERAVREHPEQWLWMHRRWKRRPPGESPIY